MFLLCPRTAHTGVNRFRHATISDPFLMSAPRGGRPSWAFSSGPRSDGGKPEYHCDKGLFADERRMRASALEDAAAFGGGAAGEAETQIAQVTQQYVEKWEGHCLSRMRNGSKSLQMHADKKDLSQKQVRSKPEDITPLLTNATAHLNRDEPPGPTIHKAIMLDTRILSLQQNTQSI